MQYLVEAFSRVGAQVDIVCKRRGKEAQERAEKEGGAHRGQLVGGGNAESVRNEELRSVLSECLSVYRSREQGKQKLTSQVDMRDIFSTWHRKVGICRVMAKREIIRRGHDSLLSI